MRASPSGLSPGRRLLTTLLLVGLLVPTLSCSSAFGPEDMSPSIISQRTSETGLRYTLAIPTDLSDEVSVPLVLALHYGGTVTPYFGRGALVGLFEPGLREVGAVIVAPDLTGDGWTDPAAVEDVFAILDEVLAEFNIDSQRTLVTGYSLGGIGTWHLAARFPERFSAAAVVSGRPPEGVLDGVWSVPLYVIHSTQDEILSLEPTSAAVEELQRMGAQVRLVVLDGPTHYQVGEFTGPLRDAVTWIREAWTR